MNMQYILWTLIWLVALTTSQAEDYSSNPSVELFQEYIQINTTTYNDLSPAIEFWRQQAEAQNVSISVYELVSGFPIAVIKWPGLDSSLGSIMLNSHMDVVPAAEEDGWTYGPFSGYIDESGDIYGRGTQDMKSVSIQYFEALSRLKAEGVSLLRDVYMTLMPDEEVGGDGGMIPFLKSSEFAALNVAVSLDEGTSFPLPIIPIFYQDKVVWQIKVDCYGLAAHGSTFPETNATATGKCRNVMNQLFSFRDEQYELSTVAEINDAGTYTSVNLNIMSAGTANNVIPSHVSLTFDIRLGTAVNEDEFQAQIAEWIAAAGDNITLTYILQNEQSPMTRIDSTNPYWVTIAEAAAKLNVTILPTVPPGSTDARFVRGAGIPAFGFSPMPNTELLLHSVNERLSAEVFLQGIDIFQQIIQDLANISGDVTSADPSVYVISTSD